MLHCNVFAYVDQAEMGVTHVVQIILHAVNQFELASNRLLIVRKWVTADMCLNHGFYIVIYLLCDCFICVMG